MPGGVHSSPDNRRGLEVARWTDSRHALKNTKGRGSLTLFLRDPIVTPRSSCLRRWLRLVIVTERGKAIFVAATKEHTGKTSVSMALIAGLVRR